MKPPAPHDSDEDLDDTRVIRSGSATPSPGGSKPERTRLGRFELLETIGEGGMGVVYRARDEVLSRDVAIKMVRGTPSGERRTRLLREAQAMAKLSHPNLVTIYDAGIEDGDVYLCMELVRGRSLSQWLDQETRSFSEILQVYLAAGRGLEAAHAAGIVHRDFKPSNVLIADDGSVQVTDFGVALFDGAADTGDVSSVDVRLTQTGVALGTPLYMSPEQHQAQRVDARTDQFSFAIALAEGVYGEAPFSGESRAELASAVSNRDPNLPDDGAAPGGLERVLRRALKRTPDERYPSMTELLSALTALTEKRSRVGLTVAAVGAAAVAAAAVVLLISRGGSGEAPAAPSANLVPTADAATAMRSEPVDAGVPITFDAMVALATPDAAPPRIVPTRVPKRPKLTKPASMEPIETPPKTIGKWRYSKDRCAVYHSTKRCSACCRNDKKLMPYPNCGCYFDWEEFQRKRGQR
jgi:predicted Ser/Thr protein kinase